MSAEIICIFLLSGYCLIESFQNLKLQKRVKSLEVSFMQLRPFVEAISQMRPMSAQSEVVSETEAQQGGVSDA